MSRTPESDYAPALDPGLYIVATPIGNLGDITLRAVATLRAVGAIACEDTRVTGRLLKHLGIAARLIRHDDHADAKARDALLDLAEREAVALVSDAGTPLISDPGFRLVRAARERGMRVVGIPGPSAAITALSIAGLPTDRFLFAGFLPPKDKARRDVLAELAGVRATLVFYEAGPRLVATLEALDGVLAGREAIVARELTKLYEECRSGPPAELARHYADHPPKGEIVVLVTPPGDAPALDAEAIDRLLLAALADSKPSQAAAELARSHGLDRKALYARALELKR